MLSKEEIEKAKKQLDSLIKCMNINKKVNVILYKEDKQAIETFLQYVDQLEQENINLKIVLDDGLDKNKKYCFYEDGNTGKCLGYSNVDDDEPCEYCQSCEALSIKGDD